MRMRPVYGVNWRSRRGHWVARALRGMDPRRPAAEQSATTRPMVGAGMGERRRLAGFRSARRAHFPMPWQVMWTLVLAAMLLAGAARGWAQQAAGATLTGTVTDISGAVIPGATVMARSAQRGPAVTATTDAEGAFALANLVAFQRDRLHALVERVGGQ